MHLLLQIPILQHQVVLLFDPLQVLRLLHRLRVLETVSLGGDAGAEVSGLALLPARVLVMVAVVLQHRLRDEIH